MKLLLYCTKAKPYLKYSSKLNGEDDEFYIENSNVLEVKTYNGKIVGECDFEVEKIECNLLDTFHKKYDYKTKTLDMKELLNESCINDKELADYLGINDGYAIHIKNLHIFDKPKELSEYSIWCAKNFSNNYWETISGIDYWREITKAPQNMMYCYEKREKKVLISIKPQWLCKILNGEKTIEIRKKVLKELENDK